MLRAMLMLLAWMTAQSAWAEVDVRVEGLNDTLRENVLARLSVKELEDKDRVTQRRLQRANDRSEKEIQTALQPYGYYSPVISSEVTGTAPDFTVTYTVDAGPPTQLTQWDIELVGEGENFPAIRDLAEKIRERKPRQLLHSDYADNKRALEDAAYNAGFIDAAYTTSELRVDPSTRTAVAKLVLDTGPRYYFGEITIDMEDDFLNHGLVWNYIVLITGEPFDPSALIRQQFVLGDLNYFSTVDIEPDRAAVDKRHGIPMIVHLKKRKRTAWNFGLGYGTDTGARARIGNEWRWLNKRGHKLFTDLQFSQVKNNLSTEYRVPLGKLAGEHLSYYAGLESEDLEDGRTEKELIGAAINRNPGAWQRRYYLEYTHEVSDFGETKASADLLTPGISLTRTELDDPIYARKGWYLFADVHGAHTSLLSTSSFVQTHLLGRTALPLPWDGRLLGRAEWGYSLVNEFDELPASQRFFAGGDQSVRGYAYESLGPKDDSGAVVGGRYLQTYSIEAEVPVKGAIGAAIFADAGNASDTPSMDYYYGVGIGGRYRAPFGSVKVDIAHPLQGSGVRLHIGVTVGL